MTVFIVEFIVEEECCQGNDVILFMVLVLTMVLFRMLLGAFGNGGAPISKDALYTMKCVRWITRAINFFQKYPIGEKRF